MEEFNKEFTFSAYHINDDRYICLIKKNYDKYNLELPEQLKSFLTQHTIKMIEEEMGYLESKKMSRISCEINSRANGWNQALEDQISHLQQQLELIKNENE